MVLPDRVRWHPFEAFVEKHGLGGKVLALAEERSHPQRKGWTHTIWTLVFIHTDGEGAVEVPKAFIRAVTGKVQRLNDSWGIRNRVRISLVMEMHALSRDEATERLAAFTKTA